MHPDFSGDYLVFGWAPNTDPIDEYPAYVGHATIRRVGSTWEMAQTRGQKVLGVSKEVSISVGSATRGTLSFGWSEASEEVSDPSQSPKQYGVSEYTRVNENILAGPWAGYEDSNTGFEELVRVESVDGYYVDLHTPYQKQLRREVASMYANAQGLSDRLIVEGWMSGSKRSHAPNYSGQGKLIATGSIVRLVSDFPSESGFRKSVGVVGIDNHLSMGWATPQGNWGSSRFEEKPNGLEGVWTKFGSPALGHERIFRNTAPLV